MTLIIYLFSFKQLSLYRQKVINIGVPILIGHIDVPNLPGLY